MPFLQLHLTHCGNCTRHQTVAFLNDQKTILSPFTTSSSVVSQAVGKACVCLSHEQQVILVIPHEQFRLFADVFIPHVFSYKLICLCDKLLIFLINRLPSSFLKHERNIYLPYQKFKLIQRFHPFRRNIVFQTSANLLNSDTTMIHSCYLPLSRQKGFKRFHSSRHSQHLKTSCHQWFLLNLNVLTEPLNRFANAFTLNCALEVPF